MADEDVDDLDVPISLQESPPRSPVHPHDHALSPHNSQEGNTHHPGDLTDHSPQHLHFTSKDEFIQNSPGESAHHPRQQLSEYSNEESIEHSQGESSHHSPQQLEVFSSEESIDRSLEESTYPAPEHSNAESAHHLPHYSPRHSPDHSLADLSHRSPHDSPRHSPQHSPNDSPAKHSHRSPHYSPRHSPRHSPDDSPAEHSHRSPHGSPRHSPRHSPHDSAEHSHRSPHGSPRHSPRHSPHDSPAELSHRSPHNSPRHSPRHSPDDSPAEHPHQSPHDSPRHSPRHPPYDSPAEHSHRSPHDSPRHSPRHSPVHSPVALSYEPPSEAPHRSRQYDREPSESAHLSPPESPRHFARPSPPESPYHSTHHSPRYSQQHPPSQDVPRDYSINVETSTSNGILDEEQEDEEEDFSEPQWSIQDTVLSALSNMATAALDFILPPLPLEPSPSDVASTSRHAHSDSALDSHEPRRGRVAFARDHDERELSTASVHEVVRASATRKATGFRLREQLSSRFFQKPVHPVEKEYTLRESFFIAYQTLGVVYGDLGTSPLYVYPTINVKNPTEQDLLGILSLIFWTLTLIGVLKYSLIVLQADDHGEGGTFALYSLLCQHANIGQHQGEKSPVQDVEGRRLSHMYPLEERPKHSRTKDYLENSRRAQRALLFVVMMGTCMIIGDGILTPAISVISAIEGIQTAVPKMGRAVIVTISAVILVLLFFLQKYGTNRVSFFFSPVMAIWFITTPMVGVYNIYVHYPTIFKAMSPVHIVYFFQTKGKEAWLMLGGTVLCITGAEAMYADMGHFNKRSIQIAFCLMVYPSVLLTYSGQTAFLIKNPQERSQGFFGMIPRNVFWPMFVVSTLAAIVASQGLISATFSIIKQSVALDYFPRVKLVHTSEHKEGQIYSPEVNYILMILCLAIVFGFRSSATIGNAFGVAVTFVMLITTCLMALVMLVIWGCRVVFVICFFLLFLFVEGVYISSVVVKVPQGGWLPFAVSLVVTLIMFTWNMGCKAKYRYEMANQITKEGFETLLSEVGSVRVPGICFFYTDLMSGVPPIVQHYVSNVRSFHRVLVFTTVRFLPVKTVLPSERFLVSRAGFEGVYRCVARYGYRDVMKIRNNEFLDQFLETLKEYVESARDSSGSRKMMSNDEDFPHMSIAAEISLLEQAREDGAVYVMGRGELKVSKNTKFTTRFFVGLIYKFLRANCRSEVSTMDIPYENYLEIGMLYDI